MKKKSLFTESRGVMFQRFYNKAYDDLARKLRMPQAWGGGSERGRVRDLARKMARDKMREHRQRVLAAA